MFDNPSSQAIKDFLAEAEEIIESLNLELVKLGDGADDGDCDPDLLNSIFRGAHSIKGLAGMFGFDDISELAHAMEDLLDRLRLGKVTLNGPLVDTLFAALETLSRLTGGKAEAADFTVDTAPVLAQIKRLVHGPDEACADPLTALNLDPTILSVLTEYEEHRLLENVKKGRNLLRVQAMFDLASFDRDLAEINDLLKQDGEVISTLPCSGNITERIAFQILFGTTASQKEVVARLGMDDVQVEMLHAASAPPPAPKASKAPAVIPVSAPDPTPLLVPEDEAEPEGVAKEEQDSSLRSISRTVRVDIERLDLLMNIVGELVLSKGAIEAIGQNLKAAGDNELARELQKATRVLERRLDELQKGVMEVRMVRVGQLFEKMIRIVRRLSNDLGKKVVLDIQGADTELDKLIIEDLSDPLMHIIRNAIDHGLEPVAERQAAGKPEAGTICLWAAQKGNHVVIEVRDDGRGIDPQKVRRKAVDKGLISPTTELSREAVFDLVFSPGFSTRDQVSDLSGRGVGMDVVKNNISALSGMVDLDSVPGAGTRMTITLPITLAIIKALIVRVGEKTYAIPINSVLETLMIEPEAIRTIEGRQVIDLRQSTLPLVHLGRIFDLGAVPPVSGRLFVAVVGLAEKKMGIVVDELIGQQDVVIKSLGSTLSFVRGIAGAADLGNQKTILVLDVGGLMTETLRGEAAVHV